MKVGAILAVAGAIVGEFIASERGLGYLMIQVQSSLDTPAMVMAVVLLTLLGRRALRPGARPRTAVRGPGRAAAIIKGRIMLLTRDTLPNTIADIAALDDLLCRPSQALIDDLAKVDGDIMILGVAGKMGPTLAGLAKAALPDRRIIGVARFSDAGVKTWLEARGIETINCDLLDEAAIAGAAESAKHHLHGRTQIRRRGRPVADLGDERPCPGAGGAGILRNRGSWRSRPAASIRSCR